jgi:2-dehydro-3-deoxyphosphogluconate aldolase/(4S)-4-hydroxy-2-oxoglutarate aldolase
VQVLFKRSEMIQNNIQYILANHPIVPVVTIHSEDEIDGIIKSLISKNIFCIEVTLRTDFAFQALEIIKAKYGNQIAVGVGTVVNKTQIQKVKEIGVDFIVSPGISPALANDLNDSGIAFIPGVATPSDIIAGIQLGWNVFKFFPANLFGGIGALKTYGQVFPSITFCPTGGIDGNTYEEYLKLQNVVSVGGSWMMK